MSKKEMTKPETKAIAEYDYGDDTGKGFEHQSKADQSIPFVVLVQALSPMAVDGRARPGDFFNTVTGQVWTREKGFLWVPATSRHQFAEWVPRDKGGGFRGHHEITSEIVAKGVKNAARFGKYKTDDGNDLTETFYSTGVICDEDGHADSMAIMAFWSTKIRAYKAWNTRLLQPILAPNGEKIRAPMFAHLTRVTSTLVKKDQNQFFVPVLNSGDPRGMFESLLTKNDQRYQAAKACYDLFESGVAQVDYSKSGGDVEEAEEGAAPF